MSAKTYQTSTIIWLSSSHKGTPYLLR